MAASNSGGVSGKTIEAADAIKVIKEGIERVEQGETSELESLLVSQCYSLNALFGRLAARAEQFIDISPIDYELNIKFALKAQSQFRASVASLISAKSMRRWNSPSYSTQMFNDSINSRPDLFREQASSLTVN